MNGEEFLVYDEEKVLQVLMDHDGMDEEDARDWLETNMVAAYLGKGMPAYMTEVPPED